MRVKSIGSIAVAALVAASFGCKAGPQQGQGTGGAPGAPPSKGEPAAEAQAEKVETPKDILTPAFGDIFGGQLKSAEMLKLVPAGWTVASASVEAQRVIIKMSGPAGASAAIEFLPKDAGKGEKGKWFAIVTPAELAPWAQAMDGGLDKSPWTRVTGSKLKNESPKKDPSDTSKPPAGPDDKINAAPPAPGNMANAPKPPAGKDGVPEAEPAAGTPPVEKPAEAKPAEAKPAEAKPAEAKPAEAKPAEAKPAE